MSLIKVPVFSKLNAKNGSLYNFQNLNNDLTKASTNSTLFKMVPSKFVCVKIPRWNNVTGRHIYLAPDKISTTPLVTDPNTLIPKLLQNYAENMSAYAVKEGIKDSNVPEWAFWKLMKTLGAIDPDVNDDGSISDKFTEDAFIKYIGDINIVNYVEYGNRTYTEQYLHIHSEAKPLNKINWASKTSTTASANLSRLPILENGADISLGLTDDPNQLTNAVYDFDTAGNTKQYYDLSNKSDKSTIDFASAVSSPDMVDFDFNAILLYYDTYDVDAKGNESNRKTKLGSVFFTDKFVQHPADGYWEIPSTTKYNASENNNVTGNAIAYRLLTYFFSTNEQATIDTVVNQYNTVSMDLYVKALSEMMKTSEIFKERDDMLKDIADRLSRLNYGDDMYLLLKQNEAKIAELTNTVNAVIGAEGYTVTNFELLDAFKKLSDDFKGLNGQNIENTFVFGQNMSGDTIQFNRPYTYVVGGKYSIGYADEAMLQIGLIRNRLLSKYAVNHKAQGNTLTLKLTSPTQIVYACDGQVYNNAQNNQEIQISFASTATKAVPYVLVINRTNGKFEIYEYDFMKKTALENFAYVANFILPTRQQYDESGLTITDTDDSKGTKLTNDLHVNLRKGENQGTYDTGDVIPAGTTLLEIVSKMLIDENNLTYDGLNTEIDVLTYGLNGFTSVVPIKTKVNKNDAGDVIEQKYTSNTVAVNIKVDFVAGIITAGQYEYSVTDITQLGTQLNNMFNIRNENGELFLWSRHIKFITTNVGTIYTTDPDDYRYNKAIVVPSNTATVNMDLEIQLDAEPALTTVSDMFLMPLKFTNLFTNLLVTSTVQYGAGVEKYNILGEVVPTPIPAGTYVNTVSFAQNLPVILYQNTVNTDVANIYDHNFNFPMEPKQWYIFEPTVDIDDTKIIFATPKNLGYEIQLFALFVNDMMKCNLLRADRNSESILINGSEYYIDSYEVPAGFIGEPKIKFGWARVDDFVTFDGSFDITFK